MTWTFDGNWLRHGADAGALELLYAMLNDSGRGDYVRVAYASGFAPAVQP